jgi:protein gp37
MAEHTEISWCDSTFNPVVGCTKVSPACDFCYAEAWAKRAGQGQLWQGERRRTKTWGDPVKWNKAHVPGQRRRRVFCASLADVFDNQWQPEWRNDLWQLIIDTPNLDWLLLTKRPQNIAKMLPTDWGNGWPHVWLGTTTENQTEYDRRWPILSEIPAAIRFLSCEPLLSQILLREMTWPNWLITGGESGGNHRFTDPTWIRSLRDQCQDRGIAFHHKQNGGNKPKSNGCLIDGREYKAFPEARV